MSERLLDMIRRVVRRELARDRHSALGVVTAVFPHEAADDNNNYEVNLRLKYEDLELRRVPMTAAHLGAAVPPREGDLVLVQFVNGDLNHPVVNGRLYHADQRPPLHRAEEILLEHRLPDNTLNHLRFTDDGTIYLQRKVTKPEDNSAALTSIRIDGATGDVEIKSGDTLVITLTNDGNEIAATCEKMNITGDVTVDGVLTVGTGPKTRIDGNEITGEP